MGVICNNQHVGRQQDSALQVKRGFKGSSPSHGLLARVNTISWPTCRLSNPHSQVRQSLARLDGSGAAAQVSMNEMMETIETFDGKNLPIRHIPGPEGVRGRNSDNALILEKLGWEPTIRLADGLRVTYFWIKSQLEEVRLLLIYHFG